MRYSTLSIANWFIQRQLEGESRLQDLTPMKLQKLLFFAQSWYLRTHETLLFDDSFQRWAYGPVIPWLYHWLKPYGSNVISEKITDANGGEGEIIHASDEAFLEKLLNTYGKYTGWELSTISHAPQTAWFNGLQGSEITIADMIHGKL